ncbi:LLM class flavin-dependent oxidoreductase [Nocardia sp. BMG51109]|uniref:LLM class flavin-dependent oxidoreductase n=1 Tax=Nocardia sp. BMG51109 TaxID=1056816 RepID=UPI0004642E25|nr:LLM class flavin-dependent oxidoreductase [Nocardia sp. BMG51109]
MVTDTFRTGLLDLALVPRLTPDLTLRASQWLAQLAGVDALFLPDHLVGLLPSSVWRPEDFGAARLTPNANAFHEPWTALGYVAAQNNLRRLRLGIGVTDAGRRNPAVTAQAAASLHLFTRGRAILGLGPGERENNAPYGVAWDTPVARFEEAVETIRVLWESGGEPVTRDSKFFPLRDAVFDVPRYRGTRPELWIGGHGPRMLRAVGRYADAWFPAYPQTPAQYREHLTAVRDAASNAGRDPRSIVPAAMLFVITGLSDDGIEEAVESVAARAFGLCMSSEVWARHGVQHPLGDNFSGIQDLLPHLLDRDTVLSYAEKVSPAMVRDYCVVGKPDEIRDQIAVWRDHGLRYPVLVNFSSVHPKFGPVLTSNLPIIRALRKLRQL